MKDNSPMTDGEARTLLAMICGVEVEDILDYVIVLDGACSCGIHRAGSSITVQTSFATDNRLESVRQTIALFLRTGLMLEKQSREE